MLFFSKIGFKYASHGIWQMLKNESNARIHFTAAILVIFLAIMLQVSIIEWILLLFAIMAVFVSEIFNSALESLCDLITKEQSPKVKLINTPLQDGKPCDDTHQGHPTQRYLERQAHTQAFPQRAPSLRGREQEACCPTNDNVVRD